MLISTKGRYALRVMIQLADSGEREYKLLDTIAEEENISEKYLENIVRILVKGGMIRGQRGRGGGYQLTRKTGEYTLGEILRLTEGSLAPVSCLDCRPNPCGRAVQCRTLPLWEKLDAMICGFLDSTTLEDLLDPGFRGSGSGSRADRR